MKERSNWQKVEEAARADKEFFVKLVSRPREALRERFEDREFDEKEVEELARTFGDLDVKADELRSLWSRWTSEDADWGNPWAFVPWPRR